MDEMFKPAKEPATELGRYRILSSHAGIKVSPLQLGAASIGQAWSNIFGSMDKEQSFKLLDAFVEAGGNFIDTANNYQGEESETWLGEWMEARNNRDYMVISTKFTANYRLETVGKGKTVNHGGTNKRSLKMSLRDSLKKLRTDWVDVLYIHYWDWTSSIKEVMDSLDEVVKQGKVLYLGISDTPAYIVAAANTYAIENGKTPFSVYQGRWNVMLRDLERDVIPMCQHFGMAIAPFDAVGGGRFQTKKQMEERKKNNEGIRQLFGPSTQSDDEVRMSEALEKVAQEHGIESPTAVALAYLMAKAPNVFPIVGGRKIEHLHANIEALKLKLSTEQMQYLESIVPFEPGFPWNFIGFDPHFGAPPSLVQSSTAQMEYVQTRQPIAHA